MRLNTWEYKTFMCRAEIVDRTGGLFTGKVKGYWVLVDQQDDSEVELTHRLTELGQKGWDLAAFKQLALRVAHIISTVRASRNRFMSLNVVQDLYNGR